MMRFAQTLLAFVVGFAVACGGEATPPEHTPSGAMTVPIHIPAFDGSTADASHDGTLPGMCDAGMHSCNGMCTADRPNNPTNGCIYGCGMPCPVPLNGAGTCTADGRCGFRCPAPFNRIGDECMCTPQTCQAQGFECGMQSDRCGGTLSCGTCGAGVSCISGRCGCRADTFEPNQSNAAATIRDGLNDVDDSTVEIRGLNFHTDADVDWFQYPITDGGDWGNPQIEVRLRDVPNGANFDLAAYYTCTAGTNASSCELGAVDNSLGNGCTSTNPGTANDDVRIATECNTTTNESGTLYIRVTPTQRANMCASYRLEVYVH